MPGLNPRGIGRGESATALAQSYWDSCVEVDHDEGAPEKLIDG